VKRAHRGIKARLALPVHKVLKVLQELRVRLELKAAQAHKGILVRQVPLVRREIRELLARKDFKVLKV